MTALLVVVVLATTACSGDDSSAGEQTANAPAVVADSPATTAPAPDANTDPPAPTVAWNLDGDGSPAAGDVELELVGAIGLSDEAISFDGYSGHGVSRGRVPVDTTQSFTMTAWANYADASSLSAVIGLLGADSYAAALSIGENSEWEFATKSEDRTGIEYATTVFTDPVRPNASWTHLAGVFDTEAAMIRLYVDGKLVGETSADIPFKAAGPLTVGRGQFNGGPGNYWSGAIGDVAVYQAALTLEQITAIYQSSRPNGPPPPQPAPDPSTYADGLLDGTWDQPLGPVEAQLILADFAGLVDSADEVAARIGFDGHQWWQGFVFDGELFLLHGVPEGSGGTFTIDGDVVLLDEGFAAEEIRFEFDGDALTFELLEACDLDGPAPQCTDADAVHPITRLLFSATYVKSSDDPTY